jgi:hypothetical protein
LSVVNTVAQVGLSEEERVLADRLCESLAEKHGFGRRATVELNVEDLRVVEAFIKMRIPRGHPDEPDATE